LCWEIVGLVVGAVDALVAGDVVGLGCCGRFGLLWSVIALDLWMVPRLVGLVSSLSKPETLGN